MVAAPRCFWCAGQRRVRAKLEDEGLGLQVLRGGMGEGFDGCLLMTAHRVGVALRTLPQRKRGRMADEVEFTVVWRGGDLLE
jgi:hypothetical protein